MTLSTILEKNPPPPKKKNKGSFVKQKRLRAGQRLFAKGCRGTCATHTHRVCNERRWTRAPPCPALDGHGFVLVSARPHVPSHHLASMHMICLQRGRGATSDRDGDGCGSLDGGSDARCGHQSPSLALTRRDGLSGFHGGVRTAVPPRVYPPHRPCVEVARAVSKRFRDGLNAEKRGAWPPDSRDARREGRKTRARGACCYHAYCCTCLCAHTRRCPGPGWNSRVVPWRGT
jgi:hypothetical protein